MLDLVFEKFHLGSFTVDQKNILRFAILNQLHDTLGIGMSTERHVLKETEYKLKAIKLVFFFK